MKRHRGGSGDKGGSIASSSAAGGGGATTTAAAAAVGPWLSFLGVVPSWPVPARPTSACVSSPMMSTSDDEKYLHCGTRDMAPLRRGADEMLTCSRGWIVSNRTCAIPFSHRKVSYSGRLNKLWYRTPFTILGWVSSRPKLPFFAYLAKTRSKLPFGIPRAFQPPKNNIVIFPVYFRSY